MLHLIYGTNFLHHSGFLIQIIHPPLSDHYFEHTGLTCYTLLSPSITFSLFHFELKTYLFRKSYPPPESVSVCQTDLMALDCSPDLFAHRFYVIVLFFYVLVIPVRQTKLAVGQLLGAL